MLLLRKRNSGVKPRERKINVAIGRFLNVSIFVGAFSKRALGSQWDRIRVICRQPFRKDKQFGLSFMRMASVPDEPTSSPSEGASGKVATPRSGHLSEEETDEDGVMRLKKASGLMGCLRYNSHFQRKKRTLD